MASVLEGLHVGGSTASRWRRAPGGKVPDITSASSGSSSNRPMAYTMSAAPGTGSPEFRKLNGTGSVFGTSETNGTCAGVPGGAWPEGGLAEEGDAFAHPLGEHLIGERRRGAARLEGFDVDVDRDRRVVLSRRLQLEVAAHDDAVGGRVEPDPVARLLDGAQHE